VKYLTSNTVAGWGTVHYYMRWGQLKIPTRRGEMELNINNSGATGGGV
jgi:hypothetical protein